jgi:hypothetical protein
MRGDVRPACERRDREAPQERGYRRLGAAVILSAVRDLEKPTRAGREPISVEESAREFLTVSNSNLRFWCRVADVDMNAILRAMSTGVLDDLVSLQLRRGTEEGQKELGHRHDAEDALNA